MIVIVINRHDEAALIFSPFIPMPKATLHVLISPRHPIQTDDDHAKQSTHTRATAAAAGGGTHIDHRRRSSADPHPSPPGQRDKYERGTREG